MWVSGAEVVPTVPDRRAGATGRAGVCGGVRRARGLQSAAAARRRDGPRESSSEYGRPSPSAVPAQGAGRSRSDVAAWFLPVRWDAHKAERGGDCVVEAAAGGQAEKNFHTDWIGGRANDGAKPKVSEALMPKS